MTLAHPPSTNGPAPAADVAAARADAILLENVSWELYAMLLRDRDAAGQHYKITYDRGRMSIMSPLPIHEAIKKLVARMIELADLERDIGIASFGSTTWRREDLLIGLESDECYYVGREPAYDRTKPIDLTREAAPDLAVEVDITRHPLERLALYASLGVREVWRYDGRQIEMLVLDAAGGYVKAAASKAMPFLAAEDVDRFIVMLSTSGERATIRAFRDWLRALPSATQA